MNYGASTHNNRLLTERRWSGTFTTAIVIILPLIAITTLVAHACYYMPFISDDALISLRYTQRLLEGHGLSWTDGQPVEGYSNLAWILLTAFPGWLGMDLLDAVRLMGVLCMSGMTAIIWLYFFHAGRDTGTVLGMAAALTSVAGSASIAVWSIGGLEQPLVAFAMAGVVSLSLAERRNPFVRPHSTTIQSLLLGLLCITRPDGPLFTIATVISLALCSFVEHGPVPWKRLAHIAILPVLAVIWQLVFRLTYYGEWVPNTALVKLTPSSHHLLNGLTYIGAGILATAPVSVCAIAFILAGLSISQYRARALVLAVPVVLWLGYVAVVGGDIFPAFRHFVPAIIIFAFAFGEGFAAVVRRWGLSPGRLTGIGLVAASLVAVTVVIQFAHPQNQRALDEQWEWKGKAVALTLKDAFGRRNPLLAVTAAGCLPYWSQLPCLDMLGLNDHHIARNRPADVGSGMLGHELSDARYVLRNKPDLVVFGVGTRPSVRAAIDLYREEGFRTQYAPMILRTAHAPFCTVFVWYNRYSPRIGIALDRDTLRVPSHFFSVFPHTLIGLHDGYVVAEVAPGRPAGAVLDGHVDIASISLETVESKPVTMVVRHQPANTFIGIETAGDRQVLIRELKVVQPLPSESP